MSQKTSRRLRKSRDEESSTESKEIGDSDAIKSSENGETEEFQGFPSTEKSPVSEVNVNGTHDVVHGTHDGDHGTHDGVNGTHDGVHGTSDVNVNGTHNEEATAANNAEVNGHEIPTDSAEDATENEIKTNEETEAVHAEDVTSPRETEPQKENDEMDPLILVADEPSPELEFDENSDMESLTGSPILSRCKTRRSQTRNIPTPKTPKSLLEDQESEQNSIPPTPTPDPIEVSSTPKKKPKSKKDLNETDSSLNSDASTKVEVGSDSTRLNFEENDSANESEFLTTLKTNRSSSPRRVSARRAIRPLSDDYRRSVLKNNLERGNVSFPYIGRESIERAPSVKRKNRSITPEDTKRFKEDSSGIFSMITSPIWHLKNKFRSDIPSSTPRLMGYKDKNIDLDHADEVVVDDGKGLEKRWCTIM